MKPLSCNEFLVRWKINLNHLNLLSSTQINVLLDIPNEENEIMPCKKNIQENVLKGKQRANKLITQYFAEAENYNFCMTILLIDHMTT